MNVCECVGMCGICIEINGIQWESIQNPLISTQIPHNPTTQEPPISPKACYFCLFSILFTLMAPSETVEPPGGRHEGAAVKMRVPTLGSVRRPVASAPAPGAVGTWPRSWGHGPSKMFIFTRFYKGKCTAPGQCIFTTFSTVSEHACPKLVMR